MASSSSGLMYNGWSVRPLTNVGGLNIPADIKNNLELTPGSNVFVRQFGNTVVIFPETKLPTDIVLTAEGLDIWARSQVGAAAAPFENTPPLFPAKASGLETMFKMMLEGKKEAPPQIPINESRFWQVVVDGKGHLVIPADLHRLLGRYRSGDVLIVTVRYDDVNGALQPVVCFRAVTATAEKDDLLSNADLLNVQKERLLARENNILAWKAELDRRQAVMEEQEKKYERYDRFLCDQHRITHLAKPFMSFAEYNNIMDNLYNSTEHKPYNPAAVQTSPAQHPVVPLQVIPTNDERIGDVVIHTIPDAVPAVTTPPPTARLGYKMSYTPFGWIEVADVDYVMPEDKP